MRFFLVMVFIMLKTVGDYCMKKFYGYSPPFSSFLIEILNTGRMLVIERSNMDGANKERADSG